MYSDNSQVTSKCGRNKEVRYKPQANRTFLTSFVRNQSTHAIKAKWNPFVLHTFSSCPLSYTKLEMFFKNLSSDDLCAQNLKAHYVIRAFVL